MKFDAGKAYPYPVLRPSSFGDDYPNAEFEVDIDLERISGGIAADLNVEFYLSDPDLLLLIEQQMAQYAVLIRSPRTHYRKLFSSFDTSIKTSFDAGQLSGRVEISPFLLCVKNIDSFQANGWHEDYSGMRFDIVAGSVLAEDVPKEYWIDTAEEAQLGSIFAHNSSSRLQDGAWELQLEGDRVEIIMSISDSSNYSLARNNVNNQPDGQYLMNGLYLPALIAVLNYADQDLETYEGYRWFSALDNRLEEAGCRPLGSKNADRLVDAQKVLEHPFSKMPIIAEVKEQ